MQKRIQLETSNERRRVRDIIQKADQLRRDDTFFEPGSNYSGGGSSTGSDFGGWLGGDQWYGHNDPPCFNAQEVARMLEDNGDGTYGVPEGYSLVEAHFDGVSAVGKYDVDDSGNVIPHGSLLPDTVISGLVVPN